MAFATTFRKSMIWTVLLALLAPGMALAGVACCDAGQTKSAECCTQAMKMPGMNATQMKAISSTPDMDGQRFCASARPCSPVPESEVVEVALPIAGSVDGKIRLASDHYPAFATPDAATSSSDATPLFLVDGTRPKILLSDRLPIILRI